MVKSEKKILIIEILLSVVFFLSIFVKNIFNSYSVFFLLLAVVILLFFNLGYEKEKNVYKKNFIFFICFYCISFIILMYGVGLIFGYVKSPFKIGFISIIKNIFPIVIVIIISEILRFMISKKGQNNNMIFLMTIVLFVLIDSVLIINQYNLGNLEDVLRFITIVLLPSIFKNWMLTFFSFKYGFAQNIIYRLLIELYPYILPITPDLGIYLESVLMMIFPVLLKSDIYNRFEKEEKIDYRDKSYVKKTVFIIFVCLTAIIIALNSNLFRFWSAVIGSGSMEPTINVGDVVIIDKDYQKHLDKLKVGDVLVFKIGRKIYTHRVIDITENNGKYSINTKGDRKGQLEDSWIVTNDNVIGVVKFKIKYIGYPTVWLSRMLEESK